MATKWVTLAVGGVGAGVNQPAQSIPTNGDDNARRHVTGFKASLTTKGMILQLFNNGQPQVQIDASAAAQVSDVVDADFVIDTNIAIQASVNNTTGGALVAGDFISVRYEV